MPTDAIMYPTLEKIKGLRNLRDALSLVRREVERQNKLKKDADQAVQSATIMPKLVSPKPRLEHLGRKMTSKGLVTHMIGVRGSNHPHYEMSVNMNRIGRSPNVTVAHVGSNGAVISKNPTLFSNLDEAIKSVSKHHGSGEW